MTVSGKHPPTPSSSSDSTRPTKPQRRRRRRVTPPSELARKYRISEIGSGENEELIGGPTTTNIDIDIINTISAKIPVPVPVANTRANDNNTTHATYLNNSINTCSSSSRFPATWAETVDQMSRAVEMAALDGHERIRVDLKNPELIAPKRAASVSDKRGFTAPTANSSANVRNSNKNENINSSGKNTSLSISAASEMISPQVRRRQSLHRMRLLMQACNALLSTLLDRRNDLPGLGGISNRSRGPPKASLFFNSPADHALGAPFLNVTNNRNDSVEVYTLGEGHEGAAANNDITILLSPCNTQGNPAHIEHVELVHYSNWRNHNLVVSVNPALMALTRHGSLDDEPRQPSFLSDYITSYYIDPVAYIARNATGALLNCFPRKWEMYLLKFFNNNTTANSIAPNAHTNNVRLDSFHPDRGFRLIGEANSRPSREKLVCEFSWRVNL